jgi:hypothetical protein
MWKCPALIVEAVNASVLTSHLADKADIAVTAQVQV